MSSYLCGLDIGGTFTDCVLMDENGQLTIAKAPSTPANFAEGVIEANSMDADGTKAGYDLAMITAVRREVSVPLIASGGAGVLADFAPAVSAGADAVLAASVLHFGELTIKAIKDELAEQGVTVRH